jgi:uroporphyrinogen decarboxylase
MSGQPVDRRAVSPILCLQGAKLTECALDKYYRDPVAYARGQAAVRECFAPDLIFGPFNFAGIAEAFGGELHYFTQQPPNLRRPGVRTLAEWESFELPDPATHPQLRFLPDAIHLIAQAAAGEVPVVACMPAPIDLPALIFGMEGWMEIVLFDQPGAQRVLERINPWFLTLAEQLYAAGALAIAMSCTFASPAIVPLRVASRMIPHLAAVLAKIGGPVVVHHAGAPLVQHLDLLSGLPSVVAFGNDETDDLAEARSLVGPEPVLFGGPQATRIASLSPMEVQQKCRLILASRRRDPRFVLYNSGPDIPWTTPAESIHAMRRAAEAEAEETAGQP